MEIFIDYRSAKDKIALAQAIRVFALTYKEDLIKVLVGDDSGTIMETDNVKLIKKLNPEDFTNLYTVDTGFITEDMMQVSFLKAPKKRTYERIAFGDLANDKLTLEEKYELLNKYKLIDEDHTFALMATSAGIPEEYNVFTSNHISESNFKGIIKPREILSKNVANVLTESNTANTFIDSLYYAIDFLNQNYEEESTSQQGFFKDFFSFHKPQKEKLAVSNTMMNEYSIYMNKDCLVFLNKNDMSYNYYYASLCFFATIIK